MRKLIGSIALILCNLLWSQSPVSSSIPDVRLTLIDGKQVQLYQLLQQGPVLIDFWATWCEPCKKALVHLNEFSERYSDQGLQVLTINQDSPKSLSKVKSYLRSRKYRFLVALDPNQQLSRTLSAILIPTTILVNRDGEIVWRHQGYLPGDEREIESQIQKLLSEPSTGD
jgi:thiol-disulfide isomerase/thioredoxin